MDREELFEVIFDPTRRATVVEDPSLRGMAEEMRGRLDRSMPATDDPLSPWRVKAPPGARAFHAGTEV